MAAYYTAEKFPMAENGDFFRGAKHLQNVNKTGERNKQKNALKAPKTGQKETKRSPSYLYKDNT